MTPLVLLFVGSGLLLCALSIPLILRKMPPNGWYGVRLPSTLRDESLWYAVNAYGGKCLLAAGVIWTALALVLPLLPGMTADAYSWIMLAVVTVTFIPAMGLIARRLRRLQREAAPDAGTGT